MAELKRPYPPGDYPLIVVGSGPAGLQLVYELRRLRIKHAAISADPGPAGMFRRFPFFDRLISWSKPFAPVERDHPSYGRFDWNSLLSDRADLRALVPRYMDGTSYFPKTSEMRKGLQMFAERAGLVFRYRCRWEGTERAEDSYVLHTSSGEYRAPVVVFAIGVTAPWIPKVAGGDLMHHYIDLRKPRTYAGKKVFILGKRNSAFETANGLLPWASRIIMASPSPVKFSIDTRHPSSARAIYMQIFEDHVLNGGHRVVDGIPKRIEQTYGGMRVHVDGTTHPGRMTFDVDEVIAATGFETPLRDLPALGIQTLGQNKLPIQTPYWESSTLPGIYFAGAMTQGAPGLLKYGRPSASGVVHGFRHNARVLARHICEKHFGLPPYASPLRARDVARSVLDEASGSSVLWNQQAYLARVLEFGARGASDIGIQPLAHFVDSSGPPALAITVETDQSGQTRPALYLRGRGRLREMILDPGEPFTNRANATHVKDALDRIGRMVR